MPHGLRAPARPLLHVEPIPPGYRFMTYGYAHEFLGALPAKVRRPLIFDDDSGAIMFDWRRDHDTHVRVYFDCDGGYGYTYLVDGEYKPGLQDGAIGKPIPDDLLAAIEACS